MNKNDTDKLMTEAINDIADHALINARKEEIFQKVKNIVTEKMGFKDEEIVLETHFIDDLNNDSLDSIKLIMEVEESFDILISDDQASALQTVGAVVDFIFSNRR